MDTSKTVTYQTNVVSSIDGVTKLRWPHNFGAYRLDESDMACGSLLGSSSTQIKLKATGAIGDVFCIGAGKSLLKNFVLKHWDSRTGMKLETSSGDYTLYPEHQEHRYLLSNGVRVAEYVFVSSPPPSGVYYVLEFMNESEEAQRIETLAFCQIATEIDEELAVRYDARLRAFLVESSGNPRLARIVGCSREPSGYEVSSDRAMAVTPMLPPPLSRRTHVPGGYPIAVASYSTALERRERCSMAFRICVGADGLEPLKRVYAALPEPQGALARTERHFHTLLARSFVVTPDAEINRGALWAKANMERVRACGPLGWGFTNDPIDSSNCVARDAAWFCVGADYFRPDFSARCLEQFFRRQRESGLIVEYFNLVDGRTEDYGLNVNDDTPLIVWSAWHHYQHSGDEVFLASAYPSLLRACRWLAAQRNETGLVWCTARETGARGIAGWRNVIATERISGAVTEVNSECYAAFVAMSAFASAVGDLEVSREFRERAGELKEAIERRLRNPLNGLYYLNIDVEGTPRTDITADLLFPVLFGVSAPETSARVLRRLSDRDFWTAGGMRTIPHDAINYSADDASGCLGGIWNGMTFSFAKAVAERMPDLAVEALIVGFENYARNPRRNNTVPGQFSEWLHGQTLVNGGMELSPWFPPRYIWATIEGVLGVDMSGKRLRIAPHPAAHWGWCGLVNAPFRGCTMTWFAARIPELHIFTTEPCDAPVPVEALRVDVSDAVQCSGDDVVAIALSDRSSIVALVGSTSERTATTAVRFVGLDGNAPGRAYDSLARRWNRFDPSAEDLERGIPLRLEPKGFALFELPLAAPASEP